MNFYSVLVTYEPTSLPFEREERKLNYNSSETEEKEACFKRVAALNEELGINCSSNKSASIFIYDVANASLYVAFAIDMEHGSIQSAKKYLSDHINKNFDVVNIKYSNQNELEVEAFCKLLYIGSRKDLLMPAHEIIGELGLDYFGNNSYKIKEDMLEDRSISLAEAKKKATKILADKSLMDEIERIYSDENEKKYYGNPVHYKVVASNKDAADDIIDVLTKSLRSNRRLLGKRISRMSEITQMCYDDDDVIHLISNAKGGTVVIDMSGSEEDHGNYASAYHEVIDFLTVQVEKYQLNTLFIFVELTNHPGFSKPFISKTHENIDIVELKEGSADRSVVKDFIKGECKRRSLKVTDEDVEGVLPDGDLFTVGEAYSVVNTLYKDSLKNTRYKAYKKVQCVLIDDNDCHEDAYEQLMRMVGLTEVKRIIGNIIDAGKIRAMRSQKGIDNSRQSMHMIFTGNPGSAKTTVARLLAEILYKEGVTRSDTFVECGRADLVGKYVGWTARTVRAKFREAIGGVLFIDEAYSLVDDSNSFGDEAINTIVQEMENHRDDTIVIFAGYPDKMKAFLDKNEGLRSRISFHVEFPDYNADELGEILGLMIKQKGYTLGNDARKKCRDIFAEVCQKPEFGNGRFVRTLLEQAEMAQASRLLKEHSGEKISVDLLNEMKAEDFEVNAGKCAKEIKKIGFAS